MSLKKTIVSAFSAAVVFAAALLPAGPAVKAAEAGTGATGGAPENLENLALHKQVTISQQYGTFDQIQGIGPYANETPLDRASMLTDGKYGDVSNWSNTADWFVFYRKMKREIVVDLGQVDTVKRLTAGFGQRPDVGIDPPIDVRYYVSNDGRDYRYIGKADPDYPLYFSYTNGANDMHRKAYTLDRLADGTPLNVQARYVKLVFVVNIFGWMDEIEVWGRPGVSDGATLPRSQPDDFEHDAYAVPGAPSSAEIRDQFLWYSGPMSGQESRLTDWTKEKALAFLGYLDIYGNIRDWFFDDILALPVTRMITPSGFDKNGNARFVTKDDLEAYLDFIFQADTQLGAIDQAAEEVNRKLHTNRKVRVGMAIPMIEESSNFGDIYGDGSTLSLRAADFASRVPDPNSLEGRLEMARLAFENKKAAVRWYIQEVERRFREAGYDNLELKSFYWYHERLYEYTGEKELIQATADFLKSKHYYFTWIPYVGPGSAFQWRDLGFTTAAIQPNFAFNTSKKAIFPAVADLAKTVGGSLEIEYDDYRTLAQYLNYGVREGYMREAPNTYYLAAMPIVDGAYAFVPPDPDQQADALASIRRSVYDRVYEYVKDNYRLRYTSTLATNAQNPEDIGVTVKLPLADNFTEGDFRIRYDAAQVSYIGFTVPAALEGKGDFAVDASSEQGTVHIRFRLHDPADAIFADLKTKRNPLDGAPDLLTLHFRAAGGEGAGAVSGSSFVADRDGWMKDREGQTYLHWGESGIVPGSPEDELVKAASAVKKAETTLADEDIKAARKLVTKLPNSPVRDALMERLKEADRLSKGKKPN